MATRPTMTSALDALWEQHRLIASAHRALGSGLDEEQTQHAADVLQHLEDVMASGHCVTTQAVAREIREGLLRLDPSVKQQAPGLVKGLRQVLEAVLAPNVQLTLDEVVVAVNALHTALHLQD